MQEKAKSIIIGRKKVEDDNYDIVLTMFDINNPHLSTEMPKKSLEFSCKFAKFSKPVSFKFMARGNDIVVNNVSSVDIKEDGDVLRLDVEQEKN